MEKRQCHTTPMQPPPPPPQVDCMNLHLLSIINREESSSMTISGSISSGSHNTWLTPFLFCNSHLFVILPTPCKHISHFLFSFLFLFRPITTTQLLPLFDPTSTTFSQHDFLALCTTWLSAMQLLRAGQHDFPGGMGNASISHFLFESCPAMYGSIGHTYFGQLDGTWYVPVINT